MKYLLIYVFFGNILCASNSIEGEPQAENNLSSPLSAQSQASLDGVEHAVDANLADEEVLLNERDNEDEKVSVLIDHSAQDLVKDPILNFSINEPDSPEAEEDEKEDDEQDKNKDDDLQNKVADGVEYNMSHYAARSVLDVQVADSVNYVVTNN